MNQNRCQMRLPNGKKCRTRLKEGIFCKNHMPKNNEELKSCTFCCEPIKEDVNNIIVLHSQTDKVTCPQKSKEFINKCSSLDKEIHLIEFNKRLEEVLDLKQFDIIHAHYWMSGLIAKDISKKYKQYDWGIIENFYIAVSEALELEIINLFKFCLYFV